MRRYTIGHINYNKDAYNKYLGPSLENLEGNFDVITTSSENKPAQNYNEIIDKSPNDYIILLHEDVSFSPVLLRNIDETINLLEEKQIGFSSLGIVGRIYNNSMNYLVEWCKPSEIYRYETVDCCFILIDKRQGIKFDDFTFNDFHLYVEDYCIQAEEKTGLGCYSIFMQGAESSTVSHILHKIKNDPYILHHSVTVNERGTCWGRYSEYKDYLYRKYNRLIKTT